jgi:hypothetical protein
MLCTLLQSSQNIFLIADGRDHDNARISVLANDTLDSLNAFHLGHGDVHQYNVSLGTVVLGYGGEAIARFPGNFSAEKLDHFDEILASEYGVVHDQISDGLIGVAPK